MLYGDDNYGLTQGTYDVVTGIVAGCDHGDVGDRVHCPLSNEPLAYKDAYGAELAAAITKFKLALSAKELWEVGVTKLAANLRASVKPEAVNAYLKAVSPYDLLNYFSFCTKRNLEPLSELVSLGIDIETLRIYPQISHQGYLSISRTAPQATNISFSFADLKNYSFNFDKEVFDVKLGRNVIEPRTVKRAVYMSCTCTLERAGKSYSATAFFDELYIPNCEPWVTRPKEMLSQKAFDRAVTLAYDLELDASPVAIDVVSGAREDHGPELTKLQPSVTTTEDLEIKVVAPTVIDLAYDDFKHLIALLTTVLEVEEIIDRLKTPQLQLSDYEQTALLQAACAKKLTLLDKERQDRDEPAIVFG